MIPEGLLLRGLQSSGETNKNLQIIGVGMKKEEIIGIFSLPSVLQHWWPMDFVMTPTWQGNLRLVVQSQPCLWEPQAFSHTLYCRAPHTILRFERTRVLTSMRNSIMAVMLQEFFYGSLHPEFSLFEMVFTFISPTKWLRNEIEIIMDFNNCIVKKGKGSRGCCRRVYWCFS